MGTGGQGRMTTHQQKKLDVDDLKTFRDRFRLPLSDAESSSSSSTSRPTTAPKCSTCTPAAPRSAAICRASPRRVARRSPCRRSQGWAQFALECGRQGDVARRWRSCACSAACMKDAQLGPRIVPIVADEARTFGMANLFRQVGIYSPLGQLLRAGGHRARCSTTARTRDGQILEEGITEAGAVSLVDRGRDVATACTACRCCRSTSTTRCSASSASAT